MELTSVECQTDWVDLCSDEVGTVNISALSSNVSPQEAIGIAQLATKLRYAGRWQRKRMPDSGFRLTSYAVVL